MGLLDTLFSRTSSDPQNGLIQSTPQQSQGGLLGAVSNMFNGNGQPTELAGPQQQARSGIAGENFRNVLQDLSIGLMMSDPNFRGVGQMMAMRQQNAVEQRQQTAQANQTVGWLTNNGVGQQEAEFLARTPEALKSWYSAFSAGQKPDWQITDIYDNQGRPVKAMIDKNTGQYNVIGGAKSESTSLMQNLEAAGIKAGTPEYRDAIIQNVTKPQTQVNMTGEKAWDTESAKLFAKRYDDISAGANNAQQMMGMYDLAEQALNSGVRTGMGAETELTMRQMGAAMGMDTDPEKVSGGELIRAVQNRMALTMRSPDGGMGMPGALSDRDIKFLKDSQIGIDRSPEGNRRMLEAFRAMEGRKIDIARLADEYVAENGRLDSGFNRTVREWAESNPLFPDKPQTPQGAKSTKTGIQWSVD